MYLQNDDVAIHSDVEDAMADKDALFKVQVKADMKDRFFYTYNVLKMAINNPTGDKGKGKVTETEVVNILF